MRRLVLALCSTMLLITACGDDRPEPTNPAGQSSGESVDYCERFGWYGDGHCDDVCARPDPDCSDPGPSNNIGGPGVTPTPDPDPIPPGPGPECELEDVWARDYLAFGAECEEIDFDCDDGVPFHDECGCGCEFPNTEPTCDYLYEQGSVSFVSEDPEECAVIFFGCLEGQILFSDEECGCGCIDPWSVGLACLDDSKPDVERVGDLQECLLLDFICEEGWTYFEDDCGCGCRVVCSDDFECPDGYCNLGVDALPHCVYPNCNDDSELICFAEPPRCYDTDVLAVVNGCWECLDARTCGPSMGP